jgi:hypothetical protein
MTAVVARRITTILGCIITVAAVKMIPMIYRSLMLLFSAGRWSFGISMFQEIWIAVALVAAAGIALIQRKTIGFLFLYVYVLYSIFGPKFPLIPWIEKVLPFGPELEYYTLGVNVAVALVLTFCHWRIANEHEFQTRRRETRVLAAFLILLFPLLTYWKTGIRTGSGELQSITQTPLIGSYLHPLESTQPILFRSRELTRENEGTVVFRGVTSESNIRKFVTAHDLKPITNLTARAYMISRARIWNLDADRFPIFTNSTDLCYMGRVPKGSKCWVRIGHRPGDDRFTAEANGDPTEFTAASKAEPPQN